MLGEVYVLWISAEIALRETELARIDYAPVLLVKVSEDHSLSLHEKAEAVSCKLIILENKGEYTAYNVMFGILDSKTRKPLWDLITTHLKEPAHLPPNESIKLFSMGLEDFLKRGIILRIAYNDVLGEPCEIVFIKPPKVECFMLARGPIHLRRGLLLSAIEDLGLIVKLLRWQRIVAKLKESY